MKLGEQNHRSDSYHIRPIVILGIGITSLIYFADILVRASQKCFWFDELCTVYLCRVPTFKGAYAAASHGADFNPPLFYVISRIAQRFTGEGLIATRLPEVIGVWLFCVCLFLFVSRRRGPLSGFVAGVLPFFTLVRYYAYEARPHGLVLGWCGLMLVCWQRAKEGRRRGLWLTVFGLSMLGAMLTHVYAVYLIFPFASVEVYELVIGRPIDWSALAATFLPLVIAVPVLLPLFHEYRLIAPKVFFPAGHADIERFFTNVMGPAGLIVLLAVALIVLSKDRGVDDAPSFGPLSTQEAILAAAFAALPLIGWLGAFVSHGPFIDRYFLSSVAGYAILLAAVTSRPHMKSWAVRALSSLMLLLMLLDLTIAVHERINHNFVLVEPTSGIFLTTTPKTPMAQYTSLTTADPSLDILVAPPLEYFYFFNYAPANIVSRLYYPESEGDFFFKEFAAFQEWAHVDLTRTEIEPFLAAHKRFLLYESAGSLNSVPATFFLNAGYKLKSMRTDSGGTLYEFER